MKIKKIKITNFRLLRNITIDLEEKLSILLGKNNCGKTSFLLLLDKFLGGNSGKATFAFDDFNTIFKEELKGLLEEKTLNFENYSAPKISLKLFIEYNDDDDLSNIGNKVIMDLDPDNKMVVLAFEYCLPAEQLQDLRLAYKKQQSDKQTRAKDPFIFLKEQQSKYFEIQKKSVLFDSTKGVEDDACFTDLIKENIRIDQIINFKWVSARRSVSNKDSDSALSALSAKMYKKIESQDSNLAIIEKFKETLSATDEQLNSVYNQIFEEVIRDVKKFGGIHQDDSVVKIVSSLQHRELLEGNTTVMYDLEKPGHSLPESYNGLGYMNLISMIFEIKILLKEFHRGEGEKPSDINLLFIEEPEAHTHPQMQCVFIKNIKSLLDESSIRGDGEILGLQTVLSTHSAHIVSESDFEDIKYFKRGEESVVSKNLKDLKKEYSGHDEHYKFIKQYLTLNRSELFFADKAIFIEGDTERVLLPSMMKKMDQADFKDEFEEDLPHTLPLLSQNISIIELGAYSQIFEKFIDFIGIKSLIITDLDSQNSTGVCAVSEGDRTGNSSLKFFLGSKKTLNDFIHLEQKDRILKKDPLKGWVPDPEGCLLCVYQTQEVAEGVSYHATTFEDAFFHINRSFIAGQTFDALGNFIGDQKFPSLIQYKMKQFAKSELDASHMVGAVKSKPSFAIEILLNSSKDQVVLENKNTGELIEVTQEFLNWETPSYIKKGLEWLKQD